MYIEILKIS